VSEMKKIVLAATFFGILLGAAIFFSSPSVAEQPQIMLQNTGLPQPRTEAAPVRGNPSVWPTAIGFLIGGLGGFSAFLIARRRA
jgi:hypothetical protein